MKSMRERSVCARGIHQSSKALQEQTRKPTEEWHYLTPKIPLHNSYWHFSCLVWSRYQLGREEGTGRIWEEHKIPYICNTWLTSAKKRVKWSSKGIQAGQRKTQHKIMKKMAFFFFFLNRVLRPKEIKSPHLRSHLGHLRSHLGYTGFH